MTPIAIYPATISDISTLRDFNNRVWPQTYTPILGEVQVRYMLDKFYTPEALAHQMTTLQHEFFYATNHQEWLAFASIGPIDEVTYKLHKLYVLPATQGTGLGHKMLQHITQLLRQRNIQHLELNVNIYNQKAIQFYEAKGFTQTLKEDIDIGSGYYMNDYRYKLDL